MHPHNRKKLDERVIRAAEAALAAQKYVRPVDVLVGIGWLDPGALKRWQRGEVDYLERVVQTNLPRISEAMKLFRSWAAAEGLTASETHYIARAPSRRTLRFSKSGIRRSKSCTVPIGFRVSFPRGSGSFWRRERAVHPSFW